MTSHDAPATQIALAEAAAKAATSAGSAAAPPPAAARPARFVGDPREFWRILLRGAALVAVTLGVYRFWLATDVRRFLWSNTEIAGESLEYNGTATELLIGFLIAIALLVPINLGLFLLALALASESVSMLGFPILFVLGQFAIYRARRYRLTRTVLRGVRCHQTGSAIRYAFCATFWWLLIVLTLGLAYPFAQASLERYKMRNTWYGDLPGRFEGSGFRLFLRGILMWFLVVAPFLIGVLVAAVGMEWDAVGKLLEESSIDSSQAAVLGGAGILVGIGVSVSLVFAVLLFPVFQAMMLRWWLSGIRFGELSVTSQLLKRRIYGAYLRFVGYAALLSLAAGAIFVIGFVVLGAGLAAGAGIELAGGVAAVALYVVVMLGYSTLYQATVRLTLWRHGVDSAEIQGIAVLDQVKAAGGPSSAVGEGLADALNVGGI